MARGDGSVGLLEYGRHILLGGWDFAFLTSMCVSGVRARVVGAICTADNVMECWIRWEGHCDVISVSGVSRSSRITTEFSPITTYLRGDIVQH